MIAKSAEDEVWMPTALSKGPARRGWVAMGTEAGKGGVIPKEKVMQRGKKKPRAMRGERRGRK